ncbi:MAG TPA: sortase [Patescibacteria group bacterium]
MRSSFFVKILAIACGIGGVGILAWVFLPIFFYEFTAPPLMSYLSPLPDNTQAANSTNGSFDDTKASNWFVGSNPSDFKKGSVTFYNLSIPRLGISDAVVAVGGEDLSQSLIQYPGTALPGRPGNATIFGHSVLPQFYSATNYLTIFSDLPSLQKGDGISIRSDGISYEYRVEEKFEVLPTDVQVLEQNLSDSFLTLVTCVPPGDPRRPRRLIIRARIVPLQNTNTGQN